MNDERVTYFAETDARNKKIKFGIKAKDRTRHVYVIGKTGMGKSTLLENMAVQDIANGEGMAFIDPHGKTADLLLEYVPKERVRDVIQIAPFDVDYPISFNVLESVDPTKRHLVVSGLMSTFKKIWVDAWSARMEYILTNTLLALLEYPGATLLGVNKMLSDKEYRKDVVSHVTDPSVKSFWVKEFASYTERMAAEAVPSIQNKVGQFTMNPLIRNMIGQPHSSFDFREAMDRRKIIVINLSKGKIGDENMKLLGGLLVTKIYLAAMSRADVPDRVMKMLPNFYLFVDEFQNFANASFADILSEARKYKLNLTIAHQYIEQMDEIVRPAVFGNVGTMITFRVGATDAEALEKEFAPQFTTEDLVNLGFAQIYLKLMIDGLSSAPFSATTLPPIPHPSESYVQDIIAASREQFAKPRAEVEVEIQKFHEPPVAPAKAVKPAAQNGPTVPDPALGATIRSAVGTASVPNAPAANPAPASPKPLASPAPQPQAPAPRPPSSAAPSPKGAQPIQPSPRAATPQPVTPPQPSASSAAPHAQPAPSQPAAPSNPTHAPQAPQASTTHKPFANLKDVLNDVMAAPQPPKTAPQPLPKPAAPTPNPAAPRPEPVKPIPLSSLAQKAPPRVDLKTPTPKNVADLKSALAAVLGNGAPKPAPQPIPAENEQPKPAAAMPPQPKEVPKEVLQKVLKVE